MLPGTPFVSTVVEDVPRPDETVPAETVQLKVGVTVGSPPETLAVKVAGVPAFTVSGQLTVTVGHGGGVGVTQPQALTVMLVEVNATQPQPSSTSTVTV